MGCIYILLIGLLLHVTIPVHAWKQYRVRRSIDLSASNPLIPDTKLPSDLVPINYTLRIELNVEQLSFLGDVNISMTCTKRTNQINLHAHNDLQVDEVNLDVVQYTDNGETTAIKIRRVDRVPKKPLLVIYLHDDLAAGGVYEARIQFKGMIWENTEGLFQGKYNQLNGDNIQDHSYFATYFRPHNARRVFPCFDEPAYKVPFTVTIVRPKGFHTLFNTEVESTEIVAGNKEADRFKITPPISTFTLGFVVSDLVVIKYDDEQTNIHPVIRIWARKEFHESLKDASTKIKSIMDYLTNFWNASYPLSKLDVVALPNFASVKPADNWGLIVFKENELQQGYYGITQELVYQWLGSWITPFWWSDAHVNKAFAGFLSASTAIEIDKGLEFEGKWPMTILYSIYYEFSKRYPHSRITAMKQETTCSKTELVLRMLNYTLGEETFRKGLQKFIRHREYKTFVSNDIWEALTKQAHLDNKLCESATVNEIAESWVTKDRIPMVSVLRAYDKRSASVTQRLYLRERPHDVPEQDKMLWWIPLVVVRQDNLNFTNSSATKWMKNIREVTLENLPDSNNFIIVNPEEIGPFPVNYDAHNWNLLANYLLTAEGRAKIPVYTRAKLLHDAWNLAYAGDLSFATAFNMTLFMQYERNHLVWNPVFTLIDHIGRHIDMSAVHKKFEIYVRTLLTPLYEELVQDQLEGEAKWKTNLRSLAKTFLCRAGYKPCIEEAQAVFKNWMDSPEPDLGNPVANQYICPVFKWGTQEEWEFGLQRVINFPESRMQSERTYLLKTLAGCPIQASKINRLLNITVLDNNGNFTDNDISLIFKMLSGGSNGYMALFKFLQQNWDSIKLRFKDQEGLWDNLINSATGLFTTQEGYDMVSQLYVQRQGEFGTAEYIIEKSLKNIKEETKWSDENLPVIEGWLDNFLKQHKLSYEKFIG
ncbi:aminopeptidase N [Topomyia yanbarensis]|uniref:aminopeptidase N n=1 Tax=Topomyia yanbarensis TaxID=2498891 RepID=UPI00273B9D80|nr:aminopeptidase N [Topomyia yanbarensis]XP_058826211.1 aminopeptidase N [Topomyia yanbarensis]